MATQTEVVRQRDLLNQLVFNRNTMAELGRVDVLWMHPPVHRVLGFICRAGFLGTKKTAFNLAQIQKLGTNSILVNAKPVETDAEKVRKLESLIDAEVWSDDGKKVGKIIDYLFNYKTGAITAYLFAASGIIGDVYLLPPSKILSFGNKRVLVPEIALQNLTIYREGIKQKLTKAGNYLKEDYTQASQELQTLAKQAQLATEQAKERAQALAEQAKQKVQTLNEQIKEETQTWAKQSQEQSQIFVEQVKEGTQTIKEQVKEKLPVVEKNLKVPPTTHPKEKIDSTISDDDEPWI